MAGSGSLLGFLNRLGGRAEPSPRGGDDGAKPIPTPLADEAFLAFISHELRTPLNAIIGYSEILQEDAVFLEQRDFLPDLQKIQRASEHLITLVDDVIDLSRIEAGRMDLQIEEFAPADVVQDVVNDTRTLIQRTFCTLEVTCAPDVPRMRSDRGKLQRALSNTIRHVTGLARQGEMRLDVTTRLDSGRRAIDFALSHSDLLLRPKDLEPLLEARKSSGLPQYHGSGLGLVIAQRFSRLMGGELGVGSRDDGGVVLTMVLPQEVPVRSPVA